jgi:hypothetical protein
LKIAEVFSVRLDGVGELDQRPGEPAQAGRHARHQRWDDERPSPRQEPFQNEGDDQHSHPGKAFELGQRRGRAEDCQLGEPLAVRGRLPVQAGQRREREKGGQRQVGLARPEAFEERRRAENDACPEKRRQPCKVGAQTEAHVPDETDRERAAQHGPDGFAEID